MTLLASFKIVLHSYTGQRDIVIGSPAFGRLHPETRGMIGFFAHPLALRTDLSGNPTFQELVVRVRETALGAYANQEAPFAKVVSAVQPDRSIRHSSLFQAMFSFLDKPVGVTDMPGLTLSYLDTEKGSTDFELFLTMFKRGEGLHGVLEYNTDLFRSNLIELLVDSFCDVLKKCVQDPKSDLAQFEPPGAPALRPEPAQPCELTPEIAIAATFTAEPIEEPLAFWMDELAIPSKIVFAPYSQVFQQLLDPSGLLSKQRDGINVVLVRLEDWRTHMGNTNMSEGGQASVARGIEHDAQNLVLAVRAMLARTMRPLVVCMCPASPAADDKIGRDAIFGRVEKLIASQLEGASGFHFISTAELAAAYPVETYYDTHGDKLAHIPYTAEFYTSLATNIARKIHAIKRASYKVIVLDCDQTLWKGVCGEDGAYGIEIDTSRRALQEFMVKQHDAGMLICLCSKNNECDVLEVFEQRGEMPLGRDHIVSWRINWRAKSENIQSLAEELQLGLENFIFIDDDPVECAEVRANCPEVLTLQLPQDPNNISRFLDHVWVFDHLGITEEGKKRTSLYRENVKRELLRKGALTLKDFLGGLDLKVEIAPLEHRHFTRASELTNRTNQFNFSGVRRSESEIQKLHQSHSFELLVVNVCDRFGDYGLVGLMIYEAGTKSIKVDTFLLSCRALGRGVEHQMLAKLGNLALMRELSDVEIAFNPNKRNQPAQEFLNGFGLQHLQLNDGSWLFKYPASLVSKSYEKYLEEPIQEGSLHPSCRIPVSDIETPNFGAWESNIGYIANELYDVEHILDALHSRKRARLRSASSIFGAEDRNVKHSESFVVPRNPIEKSLADIWIELLNVKEIGVHDNFFELGGYSLLAIQSMSRAREIFGVELSIRSFFQRPTIADVAVEVEEALISQVEAEEMDDVLKELEKLSDEAVKELLVNEMS
jgi:FkbH-like protein